MSGKHPKKPRAAAAVELKLMTCQKVDSKCWDQLILEKWVWLNNYSTKESITSGKLNKRRSRLRAVVVLLEVKRRTMEDSKN